MSEDGHNQEAEIWARYVRAGLAKQCIDFSALDRLSHNINSKPELNEMHASILSEFFDAVRATQKTESEAVFGLMVCNAIVINFRAATKDNSDADFLSRLLKFSVGKFEANVTKGWSAWVEALTWTLLEWKQTYKIDTNLNSSLKRLLTSKDRSSMRDAHYTALIDMDAVDSLLRRTPSEYATLHLLRVWEHSLYPSGEASKDALTSVLLPSWSSEGWDDLVGLSAKYVKSAYSTPNTTLFRTVQDKFSVLILNFVKTHSAVFVESGVGASVRALASLVQGSVKEFLLSSSFRNAVDDLVTFLKYTLENLHTLCPLLAKFVCLLCEQIRESKGSADYWNELSGLLVLRILASAISNPLTYGVTDVCGPAAMNALKETAKLLHHVWLGKPANTGDLSEVPWVNDMIPQWQNELKAAFSLMASARKAEPRPMILPRAMVIFDLMELTKAFADCSLSLSRFPESPSITKLKAQKGGSLKPPLPGKKKETQEEIQEVIEETDLVTFGRGVKEQLLLVDDGTGQILGTIQKPKRPVASNKIELFEESTPSVGSLPPVYSGTMAAPPQPFLPAKPVFEEDAESERFVSQRSSQAPLNMASKEVQTTASRSKPKTTQTEGTETMSKAIQALEYSTASECSQTDPENERYKFRSRHIADEVYVKDKEVETFYSWEQIAADKLSAEKELTLLKEYQSNEELRTNTLNDYWGNQFQELKRENGDLKEQIRCLKEELQRVQRPEFDDDSINLRASQMDLRDTLRSRLYMADERILKSLDPRSYIPGDFSKSFSDRLSPMKSRRYDTFKLDK